MMQNLSVAIIVVEALDACKGIDEFIHQGLQHVDNVKGVTVCTLCTGRNNCSLGKPIGTLVPCRIALEQNIKRDIEANVAVQVEHRFKARKLQVRSAELKAGRRARVSSSLMEGVSGWEALHHAGYSLRLTAE